MRRGFNFAWFLKFLGVAALVVVLVHAVHHFQVWRNARSFLVYAEDAIAKEKPRQAIDYLEQYLVLRPTDYDATERFANLLEKDGASGVEYWRVVSLREKLLLAQPDRHESRYLLAKQYSDAGQRADARQHYQALLNQGWGKADELHQKLGENFAAENMNTQAVEQFRLATKTNPQRVEAWLALAENVQTVQGKPDEAQSILGEMVAANPQSAKAYLGRSKFNAQLHPAKSEKDFDEAMRLAPDDADVLIVAAQRLQRNDQFDDARKLLTKAQSLHPESAAVAKAVWAFELRTGKKEAARQALARGLEKNPNNVDLRLLLADLLIDEGKPETARPIIEGLKQSDIILGLPEFLQARLLVEDGKFGEALKLLETAKSQLEGKSDWIVRVWGLIGFCHEQLGDLSGQLRAYAEAVRLNPSWSAARYGLGISYVAAGRPEDAINELKSVAVAQDAPTRSWLMLATAWMRKNQTLPEADRNWIAFDEAMEKATQLDTRGIDTAELRAESLAIRHQEAAAIKTLDAIQAAYPKEASLWSLRAQIEEQRGGLAKAFAVLDQAANKTGDRIEYRQLRARLLASHPEEGDVQLLHELSRRLEGFNEDAKCRLYRDLAEAWARLGNPGQAEHFWRLVAQTQPRDSSSRVRLIEIALAENRTDTARIWVEDLRRIEGADGALWRAANAGVAIQIAGENPKKLDEIRTDLKRLQERHADWPLIPLLLARLDEKQYRQDEALTQYAKAAELGDRSVAVIGRLARLQAERDKYQDAEQTLRRAEQQGPVPRELVKLAVEVALALGNRARVVSLLEQVADPRGRDYRESLWRGRMQAEVGNTESAEREFRLAVEKAPHASETWAALIGFLAHQKRTKETPDVFEAMKEKIAKNQLDLALARCAIASGDYVEADKLLQASLQAKPNDFLRLAIAADYYRNVEQSERAAYLYRRLLDPKVGAPAEIVAHAMRSLALLVEPEEGLKLLDEAGFHDVRDERFRWYLQGQTASQRKEAMGRLETSFKAIAPTVAERRMQAKLYEADGRKEQARDLLQKAAANNADPSLLADYIRVLLATDDAVSAEGQLARLERLETNSPRVVELRNRVKAKLQQL